MDGPIRMDCLPPHRAADTSRNWPKATINVVWGNVPGNLFSVVCLSAVLYREAVTLRSPGSLAQQRTLGSVPISQDTPKAFHKGIPVPRTTPHAVRCGLGGRRLVGYLTARPPHRVRFPTQGAPLRSDPGLWNVTPSAYSAARPARSRARAPTGGAARRGLPRAVIGAPRYGSRRQFAWRA